LNELREALTRARHADKRIKQIFSREELVDITPRQTASSQRESGNKALWYSLARVSARFAIAECGAVSGKME
jgi:hypothetical protein